MFIGHFEVALAAKKAASRTSLGTLILAAQFIDLLWPIFLLLGLEHVRIAPGITKVSPFDFYDYPISHSLLMVVLWSVVLGGLYYAFRRYPQGAWIISLAVLSHLGAGLYRAPARSAIVARWSAGRSWALELLGGLD